MADKKTYKEFETLLRDQGFEEEEFPQVIKTLLSDEGTRKAILSNYNLAEPSPNKPKEKGAGSRFAEGLTSPIVDGVEGLVKGGFDSARRAKDLQTKEGRFKGSVHASMESGLAPFKVMGGIAKDPSQLVDAKGFWGDVDKGNLAGAGGRFAGQVGQWATPFLKGGKAASAASEVEKFTAMTDRITAPIAETLSTQAEAIKSGMTGQLSNVAALRGNPMFRKLTSRLTSLETAPETAKGAVTAAKESVEQLANQVNSGKATSWTDLFELNKKLNTAGASIKDPSTKAMLRKLTDTVNDELSAGAGRAGMGKAYDTWRGNYSKFSSLRRTYDDILKGKTDAQLETKATAKSTRGSVAGISYGSTKANKLAKLNSSVIKQAHKAFDELHGQIKSAPKPIKPPAAPGATPSGTPSGVVPPSGPAPSAAPGTGTFNRNPRLNPVEHPNEPAPMPKPQAQSPSPQWPSNYQGAPKTLDSSGGGGANYSAADLAALKKKHGIE